MSAGRAPGLQGPAMRLRSAEGPARGPATNSRSGARFPWDTAGEKEREARAWGRSPPSASGHLLSEQGPQPAAGPGASWRRLRRASPDRGSPRVRGRGRAVEGPWGGPPPTALCRAPHVSCVSAKPPRQPPSHPEGTGAHGPGQRGGTQPRIFSWAWEWVSPMRPPWGAGGDLSAIASRRWRAGGARPRSRCFGAHPASGPSASRAPGAGPAAERALLLNEAAVTHCAQPAATAQRSGRAWPPTRAQTATEGQRRPGASEEPLLSNTRAPHEELAVPTREDGKARARRCGPAGHAPRRALGLTRATSWESRLRSRSGRRAPKPGPLWLCGPRPGSLNAGHVL